MVADSENQEPSDDTFEEQEMKYKERQQDMEYIKRVNYKSQMTNYLLSILRFFPNIKPFKLDLKGYEWWRIESGDPDMHRGFLPFYNYLIDRVLLFLPPLIFHFQCLNLSSYDRYHRFLLFPHRKALCACGSPSFPSYVHQ